MRKLLIIIVILFGILLIPSEPAIAQTTTILEPGGYCSCSVQF